MDEKLPDVVSDYIESVVKQMRYKKKVRAEVRAELAGHFADAMKDCDEESKERIAKELVEGFGDAKMLAILIRRGKKRNRPLWKKAIIKTLQVIGIFILFVLLRGGYMASGRPTISVDYSQWLNEKVSGGRDESLNAMTDIIKAAEMLSDQYTEAANILVNWPGEMSDEELELTKNYVQVNEPVIDNFKEAMEKPYYWMNYEAGSSNSETGNAYAFTKEVMDSIMPQLNKFKRLAQRTRKRILIRAYDGDINGAIDDAMALQEFGSRQLGKGLLIEQLVGVSIEAISHSAIYELLYRADLSTSQLKDIQGRLEEQFAERESRIDLDAEKVFIYDQIQKTFTDDGKGSGKVLLKGIPLVVNGWKGNVKVLFGIGVPDRREVLRRVDYYYDNVEKLSQETPWQRANEPVGIGWDDLDSGSVMLNILTSGFEKVTLLGWRLQADRAGLVTTIAILRYEKEKGHLPESLSEVVESGYLQSIAKDPFSDGELKYKLADEGFVLYSVGSDLIDNDGHIMRYEDGRVKQWPKNKGDGIFWPRRSMAGEVIVVKPRMMGPQGHMGPMGGGSEN